MSEIIRGTSPMKRPDRYTYRDYRGWSDEERWELIDGTAYSMSPAPRRIHQLLLARVYVQLDAFFAGKPCRPHIAPVDVVLADSDDAGDDASPDKAADDDAADDAPTVVQPDAFVVCDPVKLVDEGVRGAPDFIVEVLSPGTAMKDQSEKRKLYEAHRVDEYWIVNPDTFEVFVYTLKENGSYGLPVVADLREGVSARRFPGLTIVVRPADI